MIQTTAVVIGAGHAGLAMSRRLTERSIAHVVLERGEVANSWRTQRWPTLRLLTPNWQTRLPGHDYAGDDPDGYMPVADVVATLTRYACLVGAPVRTATTVHTVRAAQEGFEIRANGDVLRAQAVVLATGACNLPAIPGIADAVPTSITTLTPLSYRDPGQLADGGVLVVGASATGVQLAGEIHRSGRPVTLAVGEHVRLPRSYRGRDIFWWLEATGLLAERYDQIDDLTRARHLPSPQLTGTPEAVTTDLNTLTALGIRIVGRLGRIADGVAQFSGALANTCALADLKMNRFLNRADEWATASGLDDDLPPPHRFAPTRVDPRTPLELDLTSGEITTVLWATGFRPDHSWLDIPVRDRTGHIRHDGGVVTGAPGLYVLGMPVLRTRASTYIHGAGTDSEALAGHLHSFLGSRRPRLPAATPGWHRARVARGPGVPWDAIRVLDDDAVTDAARRLLAAERSREPIRQLSLQYPEMTIEDAYRVQRALVALKVAEGRTIKARKIGLTSRAMQQAVSISEPDYGVIFDDMFFDDGGTVPAGRFIRPRVEVELAFVLDQALKGPGVTALDVLDATRWVTPALEILDARVQMSDPETGHLRTIVDTISDNAADAGIVVGGRAVRPDACDLRRVAALLYVNEAIEETGVAAGVLGHPANGVAWLANRLAPYDEYLPAGQVILAGSFTRPVFVQPGDVIHADFGDLGAVTCRFR